MFGKTIWLLDFWVTGFRCADLNTLKILSSNVKSCKCKQFKMQISTQADITTGIEKKCSENTGFKTLTSTFYAN